MSVLELCELELELEVRTHINDQPTLEALNDAQQARGKA